MLFTVQNISYLHPNKELLFDNVSFSLQKLDKAGLIGNNGSGKSTLLKIIAGKLPPARGVVKSEVKPFYVPQHFGQFNQITVAEALNISQKLQALNSILQGNMDEESLEILNDDWTIEERCQTAFSRWNLPEISLTSPMHRLSGGEKTKVFLAGIDIHHPELILLDEPTNHLDIQTRRLFYDFLEASHATCMVVSHDRVLLELLQPMYELEKTGITIYGGNYSFYKEQKNIAESALLQQIEHQEKELKKAKKAERDTLERKQRQDSRGKKKHKKAGVPRVMMNLMRNKAEGSAAKLKDVHAGKISGMADELKQSQQQVAPWRKIKMDFENSTVYAGKTLVIAENINFKFGENDLWKEAKTLMVRSGERINIRGKNGSGKTTLIKLLLGKLQPTSGKLQTADINSVYIDQDYSMINNNLTVYEQALYFNDGSLPEHEIKIRLNRYLFDQEFWDKSGANLSGGEKMRLMLCCLMIGQQAPDLFILDEPTNNLDIQNIEILTHALVDYKGTLLIVSHDDSFLQEIEINRILEL